MLIVLRNLISYNSAHRICFNVSISQPLRIIRVHIISFQPFPHIFLCFFQMHFLFCVSFFKSFTEISQNFCNDIQYRNVSMDQYILFFFLLHQSIQVFIGPSSILFLLIFIANGTFPERITFKEIVLHKMEFVSHDQQPIKKK